MPNHEPSHDPACPSIWQTSAPHWVEPLASIGEEITIHPYINETTFPAAPRGEGGRSMLLTTMRVNP